MGLTLETGLPAIAVFLQGIFSFFSPCVLPLVPLYIGYLAGGTQTIDADGNAHYPRKKVMLNTLFFVIGVSFAFFALGLGFSAAGQFFKGNRMLLARIGGVLVALFGLYQLGLFGSSKTMSQEHRLPFNIGKLAMNPLVALVLGFTFSFAWTPCVGPALASVLLMAGSAANAYTGYLLIGVYTLGFVLPFLGVGLFTGQLLELFKKHRNVMKYTVKAGGLLMVLMGIMMFTGWMNGLTGYLSSFGVNNTAPAPGSTAPPTSQGESAVAPPAAPSESASREVLPAMDFTLTDQYGATHKLSDYKGKVVFLNFWATWCGYCVEEMPEIQQLYEEYGKNEKDVVILGLANPKTTDAPKNADIDEAGVTKFLADKNFTYPTLMDKTGEVFANYQVTAFPTTFMIDAEGNIFGYVSGKITKEQMTSIIQQTIDAVP